jgi:hypothetical protein
MGDRQGTPWLTRFSCTSGVLYGLVGGWVGGGGSTIARLVLAVSTAALLRNGVEGLFLDDSL